MSSFVCGRPHWGRRWVTLQLQTSVVSEIKRRKKSSTSSCEDFAARSHAPVTRRLASGDNSWRREIFPSARTFPVEHLPLRWAGRLSRHIVLSECRKYPHRSTNSFHFLILHFCQIKVHWSEDRSTMSSVQQSLCLRFRTPKSHAVSRQDRQHLVAVQRHRRTRRTSAAAAAAVYSRRHQH